MTVWAHVDVHKPYFTSVKTGVAVAQVHSALADGFYLGSEQHQSGLPGLEDVVVVSRFPVFRDEASRGLAGSTVVHASILVDRMTTDCIRLGPTVPSNRPFVIWST